MSRIPLLGSPQTDARVDGTVPRLRVRGLLVFRACDGVLWPLNEGVSVAYRGRSTDATIYDSEGVSGTLAASVPAFSSIDWDGDGTREEDALLLSDEEALRYYDATTGRLVWTTGAKVVRYDWVEMGAALVDGAPLWSFTTDDVAGAYLAARGTGTGLIRLVHYNGTDEVTSDVAVFDGDRCSARFLFGADGAVQIGLVRNGGAEALSTKSDPLAPAVVWGDGGDTQFRVNEFGDDTRGVQALRHLAVYAGTATRQQLLEVL